MGAAKCPHVPVETFERRCHSADDRLLAVSSIVRFCRMASKYTDISGLIES